MLPALTPGAGIGRPDEEGLAVIAGPLGVAVELAGRVAVVHLGPDRGDAAAPRGVRRPVGIGRVAVEFPQDVRRGC